MAFRTMRIFDHEPVAAIDGSLLWHPVRRELGVSAFGVNAYTARAPGDDVVEEHDESDGDGGGHEELYVVLSGRARFTLDGGELDAPAGTCVFLPDPATRRHAVGLEPDTRVLAVGKDPGKPYEPSAWEWSFLANPAMKAGDWEGAAAILRDGLEAHPGSGSLLYNLACAEARRGQLDEAAAHLREAVAAEPRTRGWAADDPDLAPLRERDDFPRNN